MTEQINYWLRLPMQVERSSTVASRRALAIVAGDAQFPTLKPSERTVAHATTDARITERAAKQRFGPVARRAAR